MKQIGSKQLVPLATAIVGIVFAFIGVTQLGFWEGEPKPGFFPTIIAVVLVITSIAAFFQTFSDTEKVQYNKNELMVILGGLSMIVGTFIIGLIPMAFLFIIAWLKVIEKAPWKDTLIILGIIGVIVLGVFAGWLQVQFPWGVFEMFM